MVKALINDYFNGTNHIIGCYRNLKSNAQRQNNLILVKRKHTIKNK
ncbi:hypothetical protein [Spiroplasma poulsonii]|nr:hypothetical protein [Spiroplasma poulsonii]UNF62584.1 hypothetical protein MNU24_03770 [Spiroplasma poulsonii]